MSIFCDFTLKPLKTGDIFVGKKPHRLVCSSCLVPGGSYLSKHCRFGEHGAAKGILQDVSTAARTWHCREALGQGRASGDNLTTEPPGGGNLCQEVTRHVEGFLDPRIQNPNVTISQIRCNCWLRPKWFSLDTAREGPIWVGFRSFGQRFETNDLIWFPLFPLFVKKAGYIPLYRKVTAFGLFNKAIAWSFTKPEQVSLTLFRIWSRPFFIFSTTEAGVCGAPQGHLSSYSFTLMAIYFMQTCHGMPCLPTDSFSENGPAQASVLTLENTFHTSK